MIQLVETSLPLDALLRQPLLDRLQCARSEFIGSDPPGLRRVDQVAVLKNFKVLKVASFSVYF